MFGTAFEVNGRTYTLKLDINAIIEMKAHGIDITNLDESVAGDFEFIRAVFFFALKKYHRKEIKSVEHAGDLMSEFLDTDGDFNELSRVISLAMSRALGSKHAKDAEAKISQQLADAQSDTAGK